MSSAGGESHLSGADRLVLRRALEIVLNDSSRNSSVQDVGSPVTISAPPPRGAAATTLVPATPPSTSPATHRVVAGTSVPATPRVAAANFVPATPRPSRFEDVCGNVLSSWRGVKDEQQHRALFRKKSSASPGSSWHQRFVCLSSVLANQVPCRQADKLLLEEAGLGEKVLPVDLNCSPEAFRRLLLESFPKLQDGGGFELLRCKAKSKDLILISSRISSCPKLLKRRVGNGKVYIRPIQRDLSLEEVVLEEEGEELEEKCLDCGSYFKVSALRSHMGVCPGGPSRRSDERAGERSSQGDVEEQCLVCGTKLWASALKQHMRHCRDGRSRKGKHARRNYSSSSESDADDCEVDETLLRRHTRGCGKKFRKFGSPSRPGPSRPSSSSSGQCVSRASTSGSDTELPAVELCPGILDDDRDDDEEDDLEEQMLRSAMAESLVPALSSTREPTNLTLKGLITSLQRQCGLELPSGEELDWTTLPRTRISVRRRAILKDSIAAARRDSFDPSKLLQVSFVDENGWDTGGPSREYWRLLLGEIVREYMTGERGSCIFLKSVPALAGHDLKTVGELIATCILQGGDGFPVLQSAVYQYISMGTYSTEALSTDQVPDPLVRNLIKQIESAETDQSLRKVFEEADAVTAICGTGFKKPLASLMVADKACLVETLKLHVLVDVKGETDQFIDGLRMCGVLEAVRRHPKLMSPLFLHMPVKLTADYFCQLFVVNYSGNTAIRKREAVAYEYFQQFLKECEECECDECTAGVSLSDLLVFFSGSGKEPVLGFEHRPVLHFRDGNLATTSTCSPNLLIPYQHETYELFKHYMTLSIQNHDGFDLI